MSRKSDLVTLAVAVAVHAGLAVAIARGSHTPRPRARPLEVDFRHRAPQAAATPAPPPREAAPRSRRKLAMRPRTEPTPVAPPPAAPPPPRAAPPPTPSPTPARPVYGVSMDSTTSAPGAPAVPVGGSALADPTAGGKPRLGRGAVDGEPDGTGYAPVSELDVATMPDVDADACGRTVSYPPEAERDAIEGDVRLRVSLDASGHVHAVRVISGLGHGLDQAAVEALKHRCRFKPALDRTGKPVAFVIESYTFHFELPR